MSPPLLDFQNVSVRRNDRLALNGLNLQVQNGEHVAILGPNGSGKTTLLKLLERECYPLLEPGMRLQILGRESWNIFELRHHLGIVSNDLMVRSTRDITGRELILSGFFGSIGLWHHEPVTREQQEIATEIMGELGVTHLAERWTDELSSGEARRLLIARALIHRPNTLVLDEPTTSLDLAAQRAMRKTMRRLAAQGAALLLVTHHLEEVVPEIERVVLLRGGQVFLDGPKREILTRENLSELFGVPVQLSSDDGVYRAW